MTDASTATWRSCHFINGRFEKSRGAETIECSSMATGEPLGVLPAGSIEDVERAVTAARDAFDHGPWSRMGPGTRRSHLKALAAAIVSHAEELALLDCLDMGKPIAQARVDAELLAPAFLDHCAEAIDKLYGLVGNSEPTMLALSLPEPRGVVAAIAPWNFPLVNAIIKAAPALAAGNCVVLKPSEVASQSALLLADLAVQAGIPAGVFNVLTGRGSLVGAALARHPAVDFLSFTGSTAVGQKLMAEIGQAGLKPLLLECGGKSPVLVFDDVDDLDAVAEQICREALWNQGQVCVSRTRILVDRRVRDPLLAALRSHLEQITPGPSLDPQTAFGPLASLPQAQRVARLVAAGMADGARPLVGSPPSSNPSSAVIGPLLLDRSGPGNPLWQEELFGPVLLLQEFEDVAQAIGLANDTSYGLAATVWTRDLTTAHRVARAVRAGEVIVHARPSNHEGVGFALPQEGRKGSGFGCETGVEGLRAYMSWKKVEFHAPVALA